MYHHVILYLIIVVMAVIAVRELAKEGDDNVLQDRPIIYEPSNRDVALFFRLQAQKKKEIWPYNEVCRSYGTRMRRGRRK